MSEVAEVAPEVLVAGLRELGVQRGDLVFVHVALSKLGHVVGGVEGFIAGMLEAVGPEGTLAMPGFSLQLVTVPKPVFDVLHTPTWASKVYERFRSWPGVRRSHHVTHSVCAVGPLAEQLTADHGPDPCGVLSPFPRLGQLGWKILLLGVSHNSNTTFHAVEEQEKLFYCGLREAPGATIIDETGRQYPLPSKLHAMSRTYDFNRADAPLRAAGLQREGLVGDAVARCLDARAMFDFLVAMVRRDPEAVLMEGEQRLSIPVCRAELTGESCP